MTDYKKKDEPIISAAKKFYVEIYNNIYFMLL